LIATEGGLLEGPQAMDRIQLSPGERAEIVVEFEPGEQVILRLQGLKDTVYVPPGETVGLVTEFDDYTDADLPCMSTATSSSTRTAG
jgi:FtsP/CotA-like multicopper oxidase with cupredoxin domain